MGSACELEYTLLLAKDLGMLKAPAHNELAPKVAEVKRMPASFIKKLIAESW